MNNISIILKNIRNLIPYLILIAIYFLIVNLEASKDKLNNLNSESKNISTDDNSRTDDKNNRISIPVFPYKQ